MDITVKMSEYVWCKRMGENVGRYSFGAETGGRVYSSGDEVGGRAFIASDETTFGISDDGRKRTHSMSEGSDRAADEVNTRGLIHKASDSAVSRAATAEVS